MFPVVPPFTTSSITFRNQASAWRSHELCCGWGKRHLSGTASAGSATFTSNGGDAQGHLDFFENSTAANGNFVITSGALATVDTGSTPANGTFTLNGGGFMILDQAPLTAPISSMAVTPPTGSVAKQRSA